MMMPINRQWGISATTGFAASLVFMMAAGPLLLFGLTAMAPTVRMGLHLSQLQFGAFATAAYVAGAISVRMIGKLTDRMPTRTILALLFGGEALAIVGASLAPSFPLIVGAVMISGIAMSFGNPFTNRLIAGHPEQHHGLLVGIKQSGIQVARFIAGLVLPTIGLILGWRAALDVSLAVLALGVIFAWRYTPRITHPLAAGEAATPKERLAGAVWLLCGFGFLSGVGTETISTYLPLYGFDDIGLHKIEAGMLVAMLGGIGIPSRISWAHLASRMQRPRMLMVALTASATLAAVALLTAGLLRSRSLIWCGTIGFAATGTAINAVTMIVTIQLVPQAKVGRATGTVVFGQYIGFAVGVPTFGALSQNLGYPAAWGFVITTLFVATILIGSAEIPMRSTS